MALLSLCRFWQDHDTNYCDLIVINYHCPISITILLNFYLKFHPLNLLIFNYHITPLGNSLAPQTQHFIKNRTKACSSLNFSLTANSITIQLVTQTKHVRIILDSSLFFSPQLSAAESLRVPLLNLSETWLLSSWTPLP